MFLEPVTNILLHQETSPPPQNSAIIFLPGDFTEKKRHQVFLQTLQTLVPAVVTTPTSKIEPRESREG